MIWRHSSFVPILRTCLVPHFSVSVLSVIYSSTKVSACWLLYFLGSVSLGSVCVSAHLITCLGFNTFIVWFWWHEWCFSASTSCFWASLSKGRSCFAGLWLETCSSKKRRWDSKLAAIRFAAFTWWSKPTFSVSISSSFLSRSSTSLLSLSNSSSKSCLSLPQFLSCLIAFLQCLLNFLGGTLMISSPSPSQTSSQEEELEDLISNNSPFECIFGFTQSQNCENPSAPKADT